MYSYIREQNTVDQRMELICEASVIWCHPVVACTLLNHEEATMRYPICSCKMS